MQISCRNPTTMALRPPPTRLRHATFCIRKCYVCPFVKSDDRLQSSFHIIIQLSGILQERVTEINLTKNAASVENKQQSAPHVPC